MLRNRHYVLPLFACVLMLLVGCADDNMQQLGVEIEGYGSSKVALQGAGAVWAENEALLVNSTTATIERSDGHAYIPGIPAAEVYRALYPASLYEGQSLTDEVDVNLPAVYHYESNGAGDQLIELPMAAYSTGGSLFFRHITGGIYLTVVNTAGKSLAMDSVVIESDAYCLSGRRKLVISDIFEHGSLVASTAADRRVALVFDRQALSLNAGDSVMLFLPVAPVGSDNHFTIRASGHYEGTRYSAQRTQSTGGALLRNELAYTKLEISQDLKSDLFLKNSQGDGYIIHSAYEFKLMLEAIASNYIASGSGLKYASANYSLTDDIDLGGLSIEPISGYTGKNFDGEGHALTNFTVTASENRCGLFKTLAGTTVRNLHLRNVTLDCTAFTESDDISVGAVVGEARNGRIVNCSVSDVAYIIPQSAVGYTLRIGGICGYAYSTNNVQFSIIGCTFIGAVNLRDIKQMFYFGGMLGSSSKNVMDSISGCEVNLQQCVFESGNYPVYVGGIQGEGNCATIRLIGNTYNGDVEIHVPENRNAVFGGLCGITRTVCSNSEYRNNLLAGSTVATGSTSSSYLGRLTGWKMNSFTTNENNNASGLSLNLNGADVEKTFGNE